MFVQYDMDRDGVIGFQVSWTLPLTLTLTQP